jgi:hypothetical protein
VGLEGLRSIAKSNDTIWNRTSGLPVCSKQHNMLIAEMKVKAGLYTEKST